MLLSSLNTGSTDLRDTEVQQPNTAATLSLLISSRAFSANSGQLEAGSTTTASSFLPSRPPFLFCSSISISITSFSVVSLIAMVPESEWRMPTLMVSCGAGGQRRRETERQARPSRPVRGAEMVVARPIVWNAAFAMSSLSARHGPAPVRWQDVRKERAKACSSAKPLTP